MGQHPERQRGRAPHHHPAIPIDAGPQREAADHDLLDADDIGVPEPGQRQLDDGRDLRVVGHERRPRHQRSHEWEELEIADRDPYGVERADDPYVARPQPDFLPCLSQGGSFRAGIGRIDGAAGQRDLAGMGAQLAVADGQRHDQVSIGIGIDRQEGGRCAGGREAAPLESASGDVAVEGAREEPFVEGNRPGRTVQRMGQRVLPAGLLA